VQRRVDTRGDVAEAFSETGQTASQATLPVRQMDLAWGRRMVRNACVGRYGQISDDTASLSKGAGGDGLGEVAIDDHRIGLRGNVALLESATGYFPPQ